MAVPKWIGLRADEYISMNSVHEVNGTRQIMRVALEPGELSLELATGEILSAFQPSSAAPLQAQLILYTRDPVKEASETLGRLVYVKGPINEGNVISGTLCFYVGLREVDFQFLWSATIRREFPDSFSFRVDDLDFDDAGDENSLKWQNVEKDSLDIISFSWNMNVNLGEPEAED